MFYQGCDNNGENSGNSNNLYIPISGRKIPLMQEPEYHS